METVSPSVATVGGKPLNQHLLHTAKTPCETKGEGVEEVGGGVRWQQAHLKNQSMLSARRD